MRHIALHLVGIFLFFAGLPISLAAKGVGTSAGTILLKSPNARAAALGEAFSAVKDDIVGLRYNPASIQTIQQKQASLQYQKGIADDFFSQTMFGYPTPSGVWGLSVGYYDAGDFELFDGSTARQVTLRSDFVASMAYAHKLGDLSFGLTGKYLRSELAETFSATALAADLGFQYAIGSRWSVGSSIQNVGTKLRYQSKDEDLPQLVRAGISWDALPKRMTLFADGSYLSNEESFRPAIGLETLFGPLALRGGFQGGHSTEFSIGTGFQYHQSWLDYSFGMIRDFETQHQISYSFRFGSAVSVPIFVRPNIPEIPTPQLVEKQPEESHVEQENTEMDQREDPDEPALEAYDYRRSYRLSETITPTFFERLKSKIWDLFGNQKDEFRLEQKRHNSKKQIRRPDVYVVQRRDTLKKIAIRFYGDGQLWRDIYIRNKSNLKNFRKDFKVGMELVLP